MTPNDIDVLIHYYVSPEPHPRETAPAVQEAIREFIGRKILFHDGTRIRTTEKGEKLVKMLCDTPDPINEWVDPRIAREANGS